MTGTVDVQELAAGALVALRADADPDRAQFMAGYAPTVETHLGATVPQARAEAARLARALRGEPAEAVVRTAAALLALRTFDTRCTASYLLGRRRDAVVALSGLDVERLAEGNDSWATVDAFTAEVAGPAWRDGRVTDADVRRWTLAEDVWTRRMALVATTALNRGGASEPERTLRVCEDLAGDDRPFVRKALSWALRALAPTAPDAVHAFLDAHPDLPPGVTREVRTTLRTGRKTQVRGRRSGAAADPQVRGQDRADLGRWPALDLVDRQPDDGVGRGGERDRDRGEDGLGDDG